MNTRALAAKTFANLLQYGKNIDVLLESAKQKSEEPALLQQYCYGLCRWYYQLDWLCQQLMDKPLKAKHLDVQCLILLGLLEQRHMSTADHAAVNETVQAAKALKKTWAKRLVNAVLRRYQREQVDLEQLMTVTPKAYFAHPQWLVNAVKQHWRDDWQDILAANNQQAPMTLRVNTSRQSREMYIQKLREQNIEVTPTSHSKYGATLTSATDVNNIPGFFAGECSVQDEAAQLVAPLLDVQAKQRVLDACAAPGGKTCHILESQAFLQELVAIDVDADRLEKVASNLRRIQRKATLIAADASDTDSWWDGQAFDRILIDAPCSGTGVIRRHPDIKLLRKPADIAGLIQIQLDLLLALWPLLKPGGRLLYTTCSILPFENDQLISRFLAHVSDAKLVPLSIPNAIQKTFGYQLLTTPTTHDGFFYAALTKA